MEPLSEPNNTVWSLPFSPQDWAQTPLAVQAYVRTLRDEVTQLHDRVETLEARLQQIRSHCDAGTAGCVQLYR